jgi:transcriptional regulator with XRE-family HTH domain
VAHFYRLLGRNIAYFRRRANLTQEKLAEKTNYSVDFIGLVERGVNAPTIARLKDIADVIGVEPWQLLHPAAITAKRPASGKRSRAKNISRKRLAQ